MQAYVGKSGKTYGPYPVENLRGYVEAGNFALDDLACIDGKNWVKLAEALEAPEAPEPAEAEPEKVPEETKAAEAPAGEESVESDEEPEPAATEAASESAEKAASSKSESEPEETPEVEELDLEFGRREPLFAAPSMNLWLLLGFLFCGLALAALFLPWYFFSGSGGETGASVWKNGLSKACSHLGFIALFGVVLSVFGAFFKPLLAFSPLPMGVAALGSLLPLFVLNTKSVNIVGTTLSISVGWGLWVCFGASLAATAFLYLNVLLKPKELSFFP